MFNTSVGVFSLQQKEFTKHNYLKDSNASLKSSKSMKIWSYIFTYSVMHDSNTNVPTIICGFHSKRGKSRQGERKRKGEKESNFVDAIKGIPHKKIPMWSKTEKELSIC